MATVGRLGVELAANIDKFASDMGKATSAVGRFGTAVKASSLAAGAGFAALGFGIFKVTEASSAQLDAELQLQNAFQATGQALDLDRIKSYAAALQDVTKFGDEVTLSAAGTLARFGQTQDAVEALLPRLQDMSTAMGVGLKTATEAVGKALSGQTGALGRYGVALTEAERASLKTGNAQERLAVVLQDTLVDEALFRPRAVG